MTTEPPPGFTPDAHPSPFLNALGSVCTGLSTPRQRR